LRRIRKKPTKKPSVFYRLNERIRVPELRVIDENDNHIGIMSTEEALRMAKERELDLIEINPKSIPPIAKISDFGQYKYQKEKELRKQKSSQKKTDTKGIRLSTRIGQHDFEVRLKQAKKFLAQDDKIKIEIILKGREKQYTDIAINQINEFINKLNKEKEIKIEQPAKRQGGQVTAIIEAAKK